MTTVEQARPGRRNQALLDLARGRPPTRREGDQERPLGERARRTRSELLTAAWHAFSEYGYRATQPADIAARAGVSVGTFYQYFRSRSDVMAVLVAESIRQTVGRGDRSLAKGRAGLERLVQTYVGSYQATAPFQRAWEEATFTDESLAEVRRDLGGWLTDTVEHVIRDAEPPAGCDPALLARALTSMLDRFLYVTFVFDPPDPLPSSEEAAHVLIEVWSCAFGWS